MGQTLELPVTRLNLFVIQDTQSVKTKGFYGKGRHHAAEDNRLLHRFGRSVSRRSQMAEKPAGEGVPGACRIANVFQGIRRRPKDLLIMKHEDAVFSALDDEILGSSRQHQLGHFQKIGILPERTSFAVVDDQRIHPLKHFPQCISYAVFCLKKKNRNKCSSANLAPLNTPTPAASSC